MGIELEQASAFFTRQDIGLTTSQQAQGTGTGYVIVRYQGHVIGIGVYRAHRGIVESMFPKNWVQEKVQV
jgi:hypothetical protein